MKGEGEAAEGGSAGHRGTFSVERAEEHVGAIVGRCGERAACGRPAKDGSPLLATSDLADFELMEVGPAVPTPPSSAYPYDMQADLLGHLFILAPDGLLVEVESAMGAVIERDMTGFPGVYVGSWAIMSYRDQVYLFGGESVARYDPQSHSVVSVGVAPTRSQIVGASAVPCFGTP